MGRTIDLEGIISFSGGIGRTLEEANIAFSTAKQRKDLDNIYAHNVVVYDGPPVAESAPSPSHAQEYMRVLKFIQEKDVSGQLSDDVKKLGNDPRTGLLNRMGYQVRRLELDKLGKNQGYYIVLDGNNMKAANDKYGHSAVNDLLAESGRAVTELTRAGYDRRSGAENFPSDENSRKGERRSMVGIQDIVAHRINGDGGDEILLFIPLAHSDNNLKIVESIVYRVLNKIYEYQSRVKENKYSILPNPSS